MFDDDMMWEGLPDEYFSLRAFRCPSSSDNDRSHLGVAHTSPRSTPRSTLEAMSCLATNPSATLARAFAAPNSRAAASRRAARVVHRSRGHRGRGLPLRVSASASDDAPADASADASDAAHRALAIAFVDARVRDGHRVGVGAGPIVAAILSEIHARLADGAPRRRSRGPHRHPEREGGCRRGRSRRRPRRGPRGGRPRPRARRGGCR